MPIAHLHSINESVHATNAFLEYLQSNLLTILLYNLLKKQGHKIHTNYLKTTGSLENTNICYTDGEHKLSCCETVVFISYFHCLAVPVPSYGRGVQKQFSSLLLGNTKALALC